MNAIEDVITEVLKHWNKDCADNGIDQVYELVVNCRNKNFYLNKKDFYTQPIAEMSLYTRGKVILLLWRKELRMPEKVKNSSTNSIHEEYKRALYKYLLFECLGNFCMTTERLITSKDYAEYDIEKDRLKPDISANGMIISTLKVGDFYEVGNEFDVFMASDDYYLVYTAHDIAKNTGGIAKIDKDCCMIKDLGIPRILTLDELRK